MTFCGAKGYLSDCVGFASCMKNTLGGFNTKYAQRVIKNNGVWL